MNFRRPTRTFAINALESLDQRIVPSGLGVSPKLAAQEALVASLDGAALGTVYSDYVKYQASGHHGSFTTSESGTLLLKGTSVDVAVHFDGGNFKSLEKQLQKLGMKVTAASRQNEVVSGYLPIANLPRANLLNHETSLMPVSIPVTTTTSSTSSTTPAIALASTLTTTSATTTTIGTSDTIPPGIKLTPIPATPSPVVTPVPATPGGSVAMANVSPPLQSIYQEYITYLDDGSQGTFSPPEASRIVVIGNTVGVDISVTGDLPTMVSIFEGLGMQVTATANPGQVGIIEGYLPIAQLPTASGTINTVCIVPIYRPSTNGGGVVG